MENSKVLHFHTICPVIQALHLVIWRDLESTVAKQALGRASNVGIAAGHLSIGVLTEPVPPDGLDDESGQLVGSRHVVHQQDAARLDEYREREDGIRDKYEDFDQVAYNPRLPITDAMAQTIQTSEIGPEIAYFLGSNPKEADRISRLTPFVQAKEIGKIEAKLAANPPIKTTTKAPEPIAPVGARSSSAPAYDTTDPRSIKTMSTADWIAADRQRQIKKAQSKQF
jgi:hypothetical protein